MATVDKYPLGQQDFRTLRKRGLVYIDKTDFVRKIVEDGTQYFFLARPRRFGKSLFLSTLQYFFEGVRDLFKELTIDSMDWDWEPYPVLRLDLNSNSYAEPGRLDSVLNTSFTKREEKYDRKYQMDGREIISIGVNFSSETRCIEDWKIE